MPPLQPLPGIDSNWFVITVRPRIVSGPEQAKGESWTGFANRHGDADTSLRREVTAIQDQLSK